MATVAAMASAVMAATGTAVATVARRNGATAAAVTTMPAAAVASVATREATLATVAAMKGRRFGAAAQRHHQHNAVHSLNLLLTGEETSTHQENRSTSGACC